MKKGFGLVEIVLGGAIIAGSLYALASVFLLGGSVAELSSQRLQASFLLEEGFEVLRFLRDSGWDKNIAPLIVGTTYYLNFATTSSVWSITTATPSKIDGVFERSFKVENVFRDSSDNIAVSGTLDPDSRKLIIKVDWTFKNQSESLSAEAYLTDIFNN